MSVYCTTSFSVCSRRRTKMPIIYPDFRFDYKVATHPNNARKSTAILQKCELHNAVETAIIAKSRTGLLVFSPCYEERFRSPQQGVWATTFSLKVSLTPDPGLLWSVPFVSIRSLCVQVLKDTTIEGVR